jgi:glutathione S-transferase
MYQLYFRPGSCSMAVHAVLNELGQKVETINVSDAGSEADRAQHRKLAPLGAVPVLVDDGHAITEGGAIISYLLDKHASPMLPKSGPARATALQWLMFANSTMHPTYGRGFFLKRAVDDKAVQEKLMKLTVDRINELWAFVDAQLGKTAYVCGDAVSAADILLSVIANWSGNISPDIKFGANVQRMLKQVSARPAFQKALQEEHVEYKAAA